MGTVKKKSIVVYSIQVCVHVPHVCMCVYIGYTYMTCRWYMRHTVPVVHVTIKI